MEHSLERNERLAVVISRVMADMDADCSARDIRRQLRRDGVSGFSKHDVNRALYKLCDQGALRMRKLNDMTLWTATPPLHRSLSSSSSDSSSSSSEEGDKWVSAPQLDLRAKALICVDLGTCAYAIQPVLKLLDDDDGTVQILFYGTEVMVRQLTNRFYVPSSCVVCAPSKAKGAVLFKMAQDLARDGPTPALFLLSKNAQGQALVENAAVSYPQTQCCRSVAELRHVLKQRFQ